MHKLSGVILTARLSSRMGAFKPLMDVGEKPMILHATGHNRQALEAALSPCENVECVCNLDYATTQQLESLRLALKALAGRTERVMISPADVPLVSVQTALHPGYRRRFCSPRLAWRIVGTPTGSKP